ncbi:MAG: hypothetical protein ABIR98_06005 [Usitatibacter sp.]
MDFRLPVFFLIASIAALSASAAVTTTVVDVPTATGPQRFLYVRPDAPIANLVSLSGGDGILGIQNDGTMTTYTAACGPVARTRQAFADRGIAVALVDATAVGGTPGLQEVQEVVAYMRGRHNVPTWIIGGSSSTLTVANVAAELPASIPAGAIFFSPDRVTAASSVGRISRPTLIVSHPADTSAFASTLFNLLPATTIKERVSLNGGSDAGCGYHLFNGLDAEFVATTVSFIERYNAATTAAEANFQALWYAAPAESEPGWGINIAHQGETLFATWFTYDAAGPMWLVMSNGARVARNVYRGSLYRTTGPAFSSVPFDSTRVAVLEVGAGTFTFRDDGGGDFSYTVNGSSGSKAITRQVFSSPVAQCSAGTATSAANFQDLWWVPSESGWGLNVTHQGDILFATWFTYGSDGRGRWLVMPAMLRSGSTAVYSGDIYRTEGAPFDAYNPSRLVVTRVGNASLDFSAASAGTFSYTLDGIAGSKTITRQAFGSPATTCR